MDSLSVALISKALDGLSLRSAAIAQNIANASSPGYTPVHVSFEERLRAAAEEGVDAVRSVQAEMVEVEGHLAADGVRLDLEMAGASATALRYAALVDVLSRQLQIEQTLVRGGQ
jgi:flagellar basal-body rod protein FlgB